jgi:myosin heavy subunit
MADNTVADLPKKNAAPAEPAKSLAATVQQVMTKAVTSPTDAKIDFAQGVNHITGDPQQKSAGQADAMQSLKAQKEADKEKEEIKAAYEADEKKDEKEKEDMKEAEYADKKDDEKKEVKEGEMPAGLKKYLDKKNGKEDEKSEEKEDEKKKDMKEAEDKKDEKKMSEAEHDKEDKKKEMSEAEMKKDDEKEMKKEMTAKDKVKDMDMKEDVAALTDGEDLSEEFKAKAATIFEAAVKAKLVEEIEKLESEYDTKVAEKVEETKSEIVEKVDAYLNYVVKEWMKDNELAIEKGLRAEITEDFIGGLKNLFESHYIDVPQEKFDVLR